jgi:hypothetical protein
MVRECDPSSLVSEALGILHPIARLDACYCNLNYYRTFRSKYSLYWHHEASCHIRYVNDQQDCCESRKGNPVKTNGYARDVE